MVLTVAAWGSVATAAGLRAPVRALLRGRVRIARANSGLLQGGATSHIEMAQIPENTARLKQLMTEDILGTGMYARRGHGDIPGFKAIALAGRTQLVRAADEDGVSHHQGWLQRISGIGPEGKVKVRFLLPTSGHRGRANADLWAGLTDPQRGTPYNLAVNGAALPKVRAHDYVIEHEVEITLRKGLNRIDFVPDHSAGLFGYLPGRQGFLDWDGT
jgi:hypothetical protein